MHFETLRKFVETLLVLKKQYPILFSYHNHLMSMTNEQAQEAEMNAFVIWLGTNPQLPKRILDNPKFASPAKGKTIFFDTVLKLADDTLKNKIWKSLQEMCKWVDENQSINLVFNKLQHNAMVKELLSDLDLDELMDGKNIEGLQVEDIDEILFSPQLLPTLNKLKNVVATGKYDYKKFLPLLNSTVNDLKKSDELEEGSKETLSVLVDELGKFSSGKALDMDKVMTSLKQDPLVSQTSFSSFIAGLK